MDTSVLDTSDWTVDDHINWIRQRANESRFGNEVFLNVQMTTWAYYAGIKYEGGLDLVETTNKYRAMGVIK